MLTNVSLYGFIVLRKSLIYAILVGISRASAQINVSSLDVLFSYT